MKQIIEASYRQIKADVVQIVESEMERIKVSLIYSIYCNRNDNIATL